MKHYLLELVEHEKILLLQGPVGPFFYDLAKFLQVNNSEVYKINFNKGDEKFFPLADNVFLFKQAKDEFADYLNSILIKYDIDAVVCFGDNRYYHTVARDICDSSKQKISFWVFEEGYLRPNYITLEKQGVNNFSILPKTSGFYLANEIKNIIPAINIPRHKFRHMAYYAMQYYYNMDKGKKDYPLYVHHRSEQLSRYIKTWSLSWLRKIIYKPRELRFANQVKSSKFGQFFIVPLQLHNDSQIKQHYRFKSVPLFLKTVLSSFAKYAAKDAKIIVKHHPMDRGNVHYGCFINKIIEHYPSLKGRVFYVHDVPLPVLMRKASGMVVVNSTSGMSALIHNLPVKVLGYAHYDIQEMTSTNRLKYFWNAAEQPNSELVQKYRQYHLNKTQISGSFYGKVLLQYYLDN